MSETIHGRDSNMYVKIDDIWTLIGCATMFTFEFNNEIIYKTDRNAGLNRKKRVRMSDCRASVSGVMIIEGSSNVGAAYFLQEGVRRSELDLRLAYIGANGNDYTIEMTGIVEGIPINADVSNFSEYDINFEGTGPFVLGTIEPSEVGECPEIKSDYWTTTPDAISITGASANGIATTLAGKTVLNVDREGFGLTSTAGTPGNAQYRYTGTNLLETDAGNPYNADETIFVIWSEP